MAELIREIVIDATPETIWPFLTEADKHVECLVHRGLPADAVDDHGEGWAHYLERLALAATGADPGPDVIADVAG